MQKAESKFWSAHNRILDYSWSLARLRRVYLLSWFIDFQKPFKNSRFSSSLSCPRKVHNLLGVTLFFIERIWTGSYTKMNSLKVTISSIQMHCTEMIKVQIWLLLQIWLQCILHKAASLILLKSASFFSTYSTLIPPTCNRPYTFWPSITVTQMVN